MPTKKQLEQQVKDLEAIVAMNPEALAYHKCLALERKAELGSAQQQRREQQESNRQVSEQQRLATQETEKQNMLWWREQQRNTSHNYRRLIKSICHCCTNLQLSNSIFDNVEDGTISTYAQLVDTIAGRAVYNSQDVLDVDA